MVKVYSKTSTQFTGSLSLFKPCKINQYVISMSAFLLPSSSSLFSSNWFQVLKRVQVRTGIWRNNSDRITAISLSSQVATRGRHMGSGSWHGGLHPFPASRPPIPSHTATSSSSVPPLSIRSKSTPRLLLSSPPCDTASTIRWHLLWRRSPWAWPHPPPQPKRGPFPAPMPSSTPWGPPRRPACRRRGPSAAASRSAPPRRLRRLWRSRRSRGWRPRPWRRRWWSRTWLRPPSRASPRPSRTSCSASSLVASCWVLLEGQSSPSPTLIPSNGAEAEAKAGEQDVLVMLEVYGFSILPSSSHEFSLVLTRCNFYSC